MLLASSAADGTVRLWDPTAHPHRLVQPTEARHVRVAPGYYKRLPMEWTRTGAPYACVAEIALGNVPLLSTPKTASTVQSVHAKDKTRVARCLLATVLDTVTARCLVQIDKDNAKECEDIDKKIEKKGGGGPPCRGFLYLLESGEVLSVTAKQFDPVYVTLSDPSFFEVTGLVAGTAAQAYALRRVFQVRHQVLRVFYCLSNALGTLAALRDAVVHNDALAKPHEDLRREVNADFVIFGRGNGDDSPSKDLRPRLGGMNGDAKKTRNSNAGANRAGGGGNGGGSGMRFVKGLVTQVHVRSRGFGDAHASNHIKSHPGHTQLSCSMLEGRQTRRRWRPLHSIWR